MNGKAVFDQSSIFSDKDISVISISIVEEKAYLRFSKISDNLTPIQILPEYTARIAFDMAQFLKKQAKAVFTVKLINKNYDNLIFQTKIILEEKI